MEEKVNEVREFLEHMAYEYGSSELSVFDTKVWAEGVLETFNELVSEAIKSKE